MEDALRGRRAALRDVGDAHVALRVVPGTSLNKPLTNPK